MNKHLETCHTYVHALCFMFNFSIYKPNFYGAVNVKHL